MTLTSAEHVAPREPDWKTLDMGIWADYSATVWLPKRLFPDRKDAKMFAVKELGQHYPEVRVRTVHMALTSNVEDTYGVCEKHARGAFECWEISGAI